VRYRLYAVVSDGEALCAEGDAVDVLQRRARRQRVFRPWWDNWRWEGWGVRNWTVRDDRGRLVWTCSRVSWFWWVERAFSTTAVPARRAGDAL
jgi:hypothetical protein